MLSDPDAMKQEGVLRSLHIIDAVFAIFARVAAYGVGSGGSVSDDEDDPPPIGVGAIVDAT